MRRQPLRISLVIALLLCLAPAWRLLAAPTATVVGNGTPASCTAAALANAVAAGGAISFACGAAPVTITTGQLTIATGQAVTIDGGGLVTLSGGSTNRLFRVQSGATLALQRLVLTDGNAGNDYGGAIYVDTGGVLAVEQSTIRNSRTNGWAGGAIIDFQGTVTLTDSVVEGNQSSYGALNSTGTLTLIRTTVRNNVATIGGGAMSVGGTTLIQASTIEGNSAPEGGAIYAANGTVTIQDSAFKSNTANRGGAMVVTNLGTAHIVGSHFLLNSVDGPVAAEAFGGGIVSRGNLTIRGSTFEANNALGYGGAILAGPGSDEAFTQVYTSTFAANQAGERGGAIDNRRGKLDVINSTFSGNTAGAGGAIQNFLGPANLHYVTLAGNNGGVGGVLDQHAFAGFVDDSRQRFNLYHTVLAQGGNCALSGTAGPLPHFVSGGYNLAQDTTCAFFMNQPGDLNGVAAQLGALADNSGAAWTHLPSAGSPLVDAAPCLPDFATDQRGIGRPQGGQCDIGAAEVEPAAAPPPTTPPSPPTVEPPPLNAGEPVQAVIGNGGSGSCTAALLAAAISAGGLITFDCGPNPVTIGGGPYSVAGDVSMDGGGLVTLSGENAHRLFHVQPGASLRMANLTLTDGSAADGAGSILNEGTLVLDTVTIHNSKTTGVNSGGGAITNMAGTLQIVGSQLLNNEAAYTGGALALYDGVALIENTVIDSNVAQTFGAIDSTGELTIRNSIVRGNRSTAGDGGAIGVVKGTATIEESLIDDNFAAAGGGGLYISPNYPGTSATVRDTRIINNQADTTFAGSLGGGIYNGAGLTLERVTIDGNRAYNAAGLFQYGNEGRLTASDTTVSNNSAVHVAGGLQLSGALGHVFTNVTISGNTAAGWAGGLYAVDYPTALQNVTFYGNSAPVGANLYNVRTTLTFTGTVLGNPSGGGANCGAEGTVQPAISGGHNVASDNTCALNGIGDQADAALNLGALADNGGPTWTHLPLAGSPAIDVAATACPVLDQRGYLRPAGAACDAGAVEAGAAEPSVPVAGTLPPLEKPIAASFQWSGFANNLQIIGYPLAMLPAPYVSDPLLAGKRRIDLTVCLYRTDMGGDTNTKREPYERIMEAFADGLFEMSNGAHVLRYVTFVYGCEPGVSKNAEGKDTVVTMDTESSYTADIIWIRSVWPNAALSGYGAPGRHLYMADKLMNSDPNRNALDTSEHERTGYTLAHEWGHYMYGMSDEYPDSGTPCDSKNTYQGPCADDTGVTPSIMSCQYRVFVGETCGDWSTKVSDGYNCG